MDKIKSLFTDSRLKSISYLLLLIGSIYRIVLWWMNRGMFIDEANLARNIYERTLLGLTQPLIHEQFAPPLFLWTTKLNTLLFGYDEKVFRFFPLLSGVVALFLFFRLAQKLIPLRSLWYVLALFATGAVYLRYATEFKQYSSDAFTSLVLLNVSVSFSQTSKNTFKFVLCWVVIGSIALWLSMTSVFVLAAIGLYYMLAIFKHKKPAFLLSLVVIASIWLAQFAFYYFKILKPQAESDYLQNFHQWYFLEAFPKSFEAFKSHNWILIKGLTEAMGGKLALSLVMNLLLTIIGVFYLAKTRNKTLLLLVVPGILVMLASILKSYSLMERMMLFYFPLWLLLIGVGLDYLLDKMKINSLRVLVFVCCMITVFKFNKISYLTTKPLNLEAVDDCLDYLLTQKINAADLYIHNLASGGYVYYTEIHPKKYKWKSLQNAHLLKWDADYAQLISAPGKPTALLTTSLGDGVKEDVWKKLENNNIILSTFEETDAKAIVFKAR